MADFTFNVAKGRVAELYNRVDNDDPTGCELVVLLLASTGLEAQATLEDVDTVSALVAGTTNEATNTNYARKILVAADLDPIATHLDDTNNRQDLDLADQTWTAVANDGTGGIGALVIAYDPLGTGVDTNIIPMTYHDFAVTPDGSDIVAQIADFYRAS